MGPPPSPNNHVRPDHSVRLLCLPPPRPSLKMINLGEARARLLSPHAVLQSDGESTVITEMT